jgi:flagellar biosynthesis/type III secretory pathway protein FliH
VAGVIRREKFLAARALSLADVEREAQRRLGQAGREAEELLSEARREGERIRAQAALDGRRQGEEDGRRAGREQARGEALAAAQKDAREALQQLTQALGAALARFDHDKRELLGAAEAGVLELALEIARRVCKLAAARTTDVAVANARAALELMQHEHDLELRVHPDELQAIEASAAALKQQAAGLAHVRIVGDETVERGGCRITSRSGTVDAGLSVQLDRIAECMLEG